MGQLRTSGSKEISVAIAPIKRGRFCLTLTQKDYDYGYRGGHRNYHSKKFNTVDEAKAYATDYTDKLRAKREAERKAEREKEAAIIRYKITL